MQKLDGGNPFAPLLPHTSGSVFHTGEHVARGRRRMHVLHGLMLASALQAAQPQAFADGQAPADGDRDNVDAAVADSYGGAPAFSAQDSILMAPPAPTTRPQYTGMLPMSATTQVGYDVRFNDNADLIGNLTTIQKLSETDALGLRLEKHAGRAYWSRVEATQEQRAGFFPTSFGPLNSGRVLGWQYSDGYTPIREIMPRAGISLRPQSSVYSNDSAPLPTAATSNLSGNPPLQFAGGKTNALIAEESARTQQALRTDPLLPDGGRDFKLAAGGAETTRSGFVGGELREGLTSVWTVEAGAYVNDDASVYARSRLGLGPGQLQLETQNTDSAQHSFHRAAYVLNNAAVSVQQLDLARTLGAHLRGGGYYTAFDHSVTNGDNRLSAGYSTDANAAGRVSVYCEGRSGSEDSRYCGLAWQIPLQRTAAYQAFQGPSKIAPAGTLSAVPNTSRYLGAYSPPY